MWFETSLRQMIVKGKGFFYLFTTPPTDNVSLGSLLLISEPAHGLAWASILDYDGTNSGVAMVTAYLWMSQNGCQEYRLGTWADRRWHHNDIIKIGDNASFGKKILCHFLKCSWVRIFCGIPLWGEEHL